MPQNVDQIVELFIDVVLVQQVEQTPTGIVDAERGSLRHGDVVATAIDVSQTAAQQLQVGLAEFGERECCRVLCDEVACRLVAHFVF